VNAAHRAIPAWYHNGMSKQIAVRLSDDLVAFVDEIVQSGRVTSRAAVVARALERERRRLIAERDARILASSGPDPELAGLAKYSAGIDVEH
jgi:Arc/MetJ-type ribon-helix-helix transcriptional regulator